MLTLIAGHRFTNVTRSRMLSAILKHPMSWFDKPENAVGSLISRLSNDPEIVERVSLNPH